LAPTHRRGQSLIGVIDAARSQAECGDGHQEFPTEPAVPPVTLDHVPALGETVVVVVVIGLVILLSLRLLTIVPGWVRRTRRPESRAIRVVGVGGGGCNAVDRMVQARLPAVSFVATNADAQALRRSEAPMKLRIGGAVTGGLGSGGDPDVGRRAAEEDEARITDALAGADLVFVTAGLGGGTGSGAAPVVASVARAQGALTIAVVTKPFGFEGSQRRRIAEAAAAELAANVDALIVVQNDRIGDILAEDASMIDAFRAVDDVLLQAVHGIIDLVSAPGLINLDFADIRSVMKDAGPAIIGLGRGTGEHRAIDAARQAIASQLLEASIEGARGILLNVAGPPDLRLREVQMAADAIRERADVDANVIFGASFDKSLGEDVRITLIATGLSGRELTPEPTPVASTNGEALPIPEAKVPSKRAARTAKVTHGMDPGGPPDKTSDTAVPPTPAVAEDDLDVPSFLRRKGQPTSRS
jgi:cell division protein FtsZ